MKILIFLIILSASTICLAEEPYTILWQNITWTRIKQSEISKAAKNGNKIKKEINGEWVYIKKIKAIDYVPPQGEVYVVPTQEDADKDGATDFITIRTDTGARIAKKEKVKEVAVAEDIVYK